MLLKLAWRNIWRNKRRTLITIASVFFAVIFSISIKGIKEGTYDRMIDNTVGDFFGYIQIHADGYWDEQTLDNSLLLSNSFLDSLNSMEFISNAVPRLQNFALVSSDTLTKGAMIMGIDPEREDRLSGMSKRVIDGKMISEGSSEVALGHKLADFLKLKTGDTLVVMGQGYHGNMAAGKFPISGLLKFPYPEFNDLFVVIPIEATQYLMSADSRATAMVIDLDNPDKMKKNTKRLSSFLGGSYEVMDWEEMLPELQKMIQFDRAEGYILMGILYILVSFGIFGTVLMMLAERMYEFGIMIAIGMKKRKLASLVWIEMIIITLLGGFSGMLTGYPLLVYFNYNPIYLGQDLAEVYEEFGFEPVLQTSTDVSLLFQQGFIIIFLATIISIYPVIRILKLNTIKAMRA